MSQEYVLTIPSLGRAETFTALDAFQGLDCRKFIFVDNARERRAYKRVVGKRAKVIDCHAKPPWCVSNVRNIAFDRFGTGAHVLCLCDDVKALHILDASQPRKLRKLTIEEIELVIDRGFKDCKSVGTKLWGVYPVKNAFYMKSKVSARVFVIDAFSGVIVGKLRWDEEQRFKADYDFTIQHISRYGCIVRYDCICVDAPYNTTEGGCLAYRTQSAEAAAVERLKTKWPHFVHDNPRRFNEILLRFPRTGAGKRAILKKKGGGRMAKQKRSIVKVKKQTEKPQMEMNFSRAIAIIKSKCPKKWARAHAKSIPITRKAHGLRGVYVQALYILEHTQDWDDEYGAVEFLRDWTKKHREEAEHVAQAGRGGDDNSGADGCAQVSR